MGKYVIGIDFGTDSCRTVITDTLDGRELSSAVFYYPRWKQGLYCDASKMQYRQHPLDYIEGLKHTVKAALELVDADVREGIVAISVDTTGSTPCAIDKNGVPLALLPEFSENPNAMFILWKDHTSIKEAEEITAMAKNGTGPDYTKYVGGIYSSEWFFAKALKAMRTDPEIRTAAYSWIEHCDWIPFYLTGKQGAKNIVRSRCAGGHKGMWNDEFGGLPPNSFFKEIDPLLDGLRDRLYQHTYTSDYCVGNISPDFADEFGLSHGVKIGVGAFDCHMGAVGGNIAPRSIVKVMGTSTCDIIITDKEQLAGKCVDGICGQVDGSVISGMIGLEAGQSAFGDLFAWFKRLLAWTTSLIPADKMNPAEIESLEDKILFELEKEAAKIQPSENGVLALDWINGRRTPYANQNLKGAISGLTLGSDAPEVYHALIEAAAFGSKAIIERFRQCGIVIDDAIAIGGVAKKSPLTMQILADICNMPIKVCRSEQACALGASIFAAVVGEVYPDAASAQQKMAGSFEQTYYPDKARAEIYAKKYNSYLKLGKLTESMAGIFAERQG